MTDKISLTFIKRTIAPVLQKNDVVKAGIFGSYARGEATSKSDIDILIQFKGRKTLFDLVRLERKLKVVLHKKVDLLTYNSLHHLIKDKVLKEEMKVL